MYCTKLYLEMSNLALDFYKLGENRDNVGRETLLNE